jgi:elongation factor P hydroxylase
MAHWCIAGEHRRTLPDFGYWYEPDGRTEQQQKTFERVEIKPQAIEWHFANACGRTFRVSVDNLSGEPTDSKPFQLAVAEQARQYQQQGLPSRAADISRLLRNAFLNGSDESFEFDLNP